MGSDALLPRLHSTAAHAHSDRQRPGADNVGGSLNRARDVAVSEHWSLPAWAISFYFVKFTKCVFSVVWFAEEVTFLSGTLG